MISMAKAKYSAKLAIFILNGKTYRAKSTGEAITQAARAQGFSLSDNVAEILGDRNANNRDQML